MKKIKNTFLLLFLSACSVFGLSVVHAADVFYIDNSLSTICNPSSIKAGETTSCYVIANPDVNDDDYKVYGFFTAAFTTKSLSIVGAKVNPTITGSAVAFANEGEASRDPGWTSSSGTVPTSFSTITCVRDNTWYDAAKTRFPTEVSSAINTYGCAIYYSTSGNAYSKNTLKSNDNYKTTILAGRQNYGVIGYYEVKLPSDSKENGVCGAFCVKAIVINESADLATLSTNSNNAQNCTEIHQTSSTTNPGDTPETGAFTSYMVLVAGALIAIGAITITRKNNRFNKI